LRGKPRRLTEEGVAKLKPPPPGKQKDYYDTVMPGLVLRLNYGGKKTFRALYYVPSIAKSGKRKGQRISMPTTRELGRYPTLKLKEARDKARVFLADPQQALAQTDVGSFQEVAANFIKRHVEKNGLRTQGDIERLLRTLVHPSWGQRPFRDLRRSDVIVLLDSIEDKHGARQADLVLAIIRSMMNWYASRNDDYTSPVVRGMHRYDSSAHKRDRWLTDAEVKALWRLRRRGDIRLTGQDAAAHRAAAHQGALLAAQTPLKTVDGGGCAAIDLQCTGRNQPSRISCAMPRASLRSVFTGIVDSAVFTCRVSSSSTASPASRSAP
jgi:hypothetical protein